MQKRKENDEVKEQNKTKKIKFSNEFNESDNSAGKNLKNQETNKIDKKTTKKSKIKNENNGRFHKKDKLNDSKYPTPKNFKTNSKFSNKKFQPQSNEKPEDWNEFKKKKKELRMKRKQTKTGFDVIEKAKKLGEKLRCKNLKGGQDERNKLLNQLHSMLKGENFYPKFVLAHDTSRIVQWLLKYGSTIIKEQISKEVLPVAIEMLQSKYGIHCVKRLLKYGDNQTKSDLIKAMYGHAVKLASHSLSAPIFEYAYTNCASLQQKQHLLQEFFGDLYKNTKDNEIKHLNETYKDSPSLKSAILSATKANLIRVLNKNLLDSTLVQTVLYQYLSECSEDDKNELITQLIPHIVVISNSKDGARVAMQCIWRGTNKDKKTALKALKEHTIELCKHEHGHCTIITVIDSIDDTVLVNKIILSEILKNVQELAVNEWGRKVLLWLVAPSDSTCFHPVFIKELEDGLKTSLSKKEKTLRRKEILQYSSNTLLDLIESKPEFWLSTTSLAYLMLHIIKSGSGESVKRVFESIAKVIVNPEWKIKVNDKEVTGIEDAGFHMVLKKLAQHDKVNLEQNEATFGSALAEIIEKEALKLWITLNRGCFILIALYENGSEDTQNKLKEKLSEHLSILKKQSTTGAKILLKKVK